ncbi:MAG: NUDIX hydrolase [Acidobacteriota bacterium]
MIDVTSSQLPLGAGSGSSDVEALPAATTIVLRGDPFEVLLLRRHEKSTFVPGSWVFPGGAVDDADRAAAETMATGDRTLNVMKISAIRELFEEAGIWTGTAPDDLQSRRQTLLHSAGGFAELLSQFPVDLDQLVLTARWITPLGVRKRYDTWFFLVEVPPHSVATADEREAVEITWVTPSEALERNRNGAMPMVFPTIRNLEAIVEYSSPAALLSARRSAKVKTTRPILVVDGDSKKIILPDDGS